MVKGLDLFRERFAAYADGYVLIGGAACDVWFANAGLAFRATKDLDIVLVVEAVNKAFVAALREFMEDGKYEIRERTDGSPELYRFCKPQTDGFPFMIELLTRKPETLELAGDQRIIPVAAPESEARLSAILVDDNYYALIREYREVRNGLPTATATALISLKARAWLDLSARKADGANLDQKNIDKHRGDVFRLAATLPGEAGPELAPAIMDDLRSFLAAFPEGSAEWKNILTSLAGTFGGRKLFPADLRAAISTFFRLG